MNVRYNVHASVFVPLCATGGAADARGIKSPRPDNGQTVANGGKTFTLLPPPVAPASYFAPAQQQQQLSWQQEWALAVSHQWTPIWSGLFLQTPESQAGPPLKLYGAQQPRCGRKIVAPLAERAYGTDMVRQLERIADTWIGANTSGKYLATLKSSRV